MTDKKAFGRTKGYGIDGQSWSEVCFVHIFPDSMGELLPQALCISELIFGLPGSPSSHGSQGTGRNRRISNESREEGGVPSRDASGASILFVNTRIENLQ